MPSGLEADEESPLRLWDTSSDADKDDTGSKAGICINSDVPHMVESAYFSGHVLFYVEGLPSSPARLFKGHKRRSHLIVKGRFKRPVSYEDAVTGQRFSRPLKRLPSPWFLEFVLMLARQLSPSMQIGCQEAPYILSPMISTAQAINVEEEGDSSSIDAWPLEDMRAVGITAGSGDSPLPAARRRRLFSDVKSRRGREFSPAHMYTFHFWQHMLDCAKFKLDMGIASFDLARHLDGQPLQLMAQHSSSSGYIWRLLLHHQCQGGSMGSDL
ncbi:hypothetical protein CVIRNUC_007001 [Coccomyxa viridis]|uniref:Domain of unknown function at the cortex 1 domain-containing protein n=1 Tax=Coccomyxa viridis TaxID=1274662 RepID=A0AAV1IAP3_9CHLO|nr:hypothetical protein CVIRNUC_007001 [Coccomyxa viridis]